MPRRDLARLSASIPTTSHLGREQQDAQSDKKLTDADYRVLRYLQVPGIVGVRADFAPGSILETAWQHVFEMKSARKKPC